MVAICGTYFHWKVKQGSFLNFRLIDNRIWTFDRFVIEIWREVVGTKTFESW